ncbi:glycosyltransferase [Gluconobacter morbifer]|uniref:Glycosyltransferase n=1 Tax=Gluconobacter morbifer G707 TaxID=1088869 RepID=G6XG92_9PROT|nr:glycosyltransferase [Gluconobacter morbifer]EHH69200.1 hypothetical protein GMO_05070 [Gluconobacter morbifer G707]
MSEKTDGGKDFPAVRGLVERVDRVSIKGWACDGSEQPVRLRLYCNDIVLGSVTADQYRPDLQESGGGSGHHGFIFIVEGGLPAGRRLKIRACREEDEAELPGSPYRVGFPTLGTAPAAVSPGRKSEGSGFLDIVERRRIQGWTWDSQQPEKSFLVQIIDNGEVLAETVANRFRPDLEKAGVGSGHFGFSIVLPTGLTPTRRHVIRVIREDGVELDGSPHVLEPLSVFNDELLCFLRAEAQAVGSREEQERVAALCLETASTLRKCANRDLTRHTDLAVDRELALRLCEEGSAVPDSRSNMRALVVDARYPDPNRDAGSNAILSHMRALVDLGYEVFFTAMGEGRPDQARIDALIRDGIQPLHAPLFETVETVIRGQPNSFGLIYLHRVEVALAYIGLVRLYQKQARVLFSVADLSHVRLQRQAEELDDPLAEANARRMKTLERICAIQADAVITHSPEELRLLGALAPRTPAFVVPWAVQTPPVSPRLEGRHGCIFVGHYGHLPNDDAAIWLIQEIVPRIHERRPDIPCYLAGSYMPEHLRSLGRENVTILGYVPALADALANVRVGLAPLRFGAGIKGKVLDMLGHGLPVVMTPVAAEGIPLTPGLAKLVRQTADEIADSVIALHETDDAGGYGREGVAFIRDHYSAADVVRAMREAIAALS